MTMPMERGPARRVGGWTLITGLTIALLVTSVGWFLSAREGQGIPLDCYSGNGTALTVGSIHGNDTRLATFSVAEEDDRVVVGYWEKVAGGIHTAEGYASELTYGLVRPLGDRSVVDPSGAAIAPCQASQ